MKDFLLVLLIIVLGWIILRGQMKVMKHAWRRTLYHWRRTLHHFGDVTILLGVSVLGAIIVVIVLYAFIQDGL